MKKKIIFHSNGTTAVFDEQGTPLPALQQAWLKVFANFLEEHDEDPTEFEFTLPNGWKAECFETESRYNWRFV